MSVIEEWVECHQVMFSHSIASLFDSLFILYWNNIQAKWYKFDNLYFSNIWKLFSALLMKSIHDFHVEQRHFFHRLLSYSFILSPSVFKFWLSRLLDIWFWLESLWHWDLLLIILKNRWSKISSLRYLFLTLSFSLHKLTWGQSIQAN